MVAGLVVTEGIAKVSFDPAPNLSDFGPGFIANSNLGVGATANLTGSSLAVNLDVGARDGGLKEKATSPALELNPVSNSDTAQTTECRLVFMDAEPFN